MNSRPAPGGYEMERELDNQVASLPPSLPPIHESCWLDLKGGRYCSFFVPRPPLKRGRGELSPLLRPKSFQILCGNDATRLSLRGLWYGLRRSFRKTVEVELPHLFAKSMNAKK